jgi:hypothetical protein
LEKNLTVPASGQIGLYFINGGSQGEDTVYFDDVSLSLTDLDFSFDGNLPEVDTDTKTRLFWVDDVYYLFYSTTQDDEYYLYLTTSTQGAEESWSEPVDIFENSIKPDNPSGTIEGNGLFSVDYNEENGYFGAAIFASGTTEIWFASSTDGVNWATSTVVNNVSV